MSIIDLALSPELSFNIRLTNLLSPSFLDVFRVVHLVLLVQLHIFLIFLVHIILPVC